METQLALRWRANPSKAQCIAWWGHGVKLASKQQEKSWCLCNTVRTTLLWKAKRLLFIKVFIRKPIHGELCGTQFIELSGSGVRSALPGIDAVCKLSKLEVSAHCYVSL